MLQERLGNTGVRSKEDYKYGPSLESKPEEVKLKKQNLLKLIEGSKGDADSVQVFICGKEIWYWAPFDLAAKDKTKSSGWKYNLDKFYLEMWSNF